MNAPDKRAPLAEPKVDLIPVDSLAPSQTHVQQLRRKRFNPDKITEIAASLLKVGQLQAIVVRPHPKGQPQFEIVLGERRWLAAQQAGLKLIEAKILQMDDGKVLEAQLIENIQREDLHPLEEAAGYDELMRVGKIKKEDLGERVGMSRSWVYSRLNLLKLDGPAREALQSGRIDVSRAMVVASVADAAQRTHVLQLALETTGNDKPTYSVRELRQKIVENQYCLRLVGASFDMNDAKLVPAVGACGECPYRTANCDPEALDPDVCTNLTCFNLKVKTAGANRRAAILVGGGKVLKGDDARKISPSIKTIYGHVDLDLVCEYDDFPEKMPPQPKDGEEDDHGERLDGPYIAWREREKLWQPRTHRALLAGQKLDTVIIDDPKTKSLRELLPFKIAQALLKKHGISLPSYADKKRHHFQRTAPSGSPSGKPASKEEQAKQAARIKAEEDKRQLDEKVERTVTMRILAAVKAKHVGQLTVAEWAWCIQGATEDIDDDISEAVWKMYGQKDPGWQCKKTVEKIAAKDLPGLFTLLLLAQSLGDSYGKAQEIALGTMARFKIDRKKIEAEVRAELTPKRPVDKVMADIKKREAKASAKPTPKKRK